MTALLLGLSLLRQTPPDPRAFIFDGEGTSLTMPVASTDTLPTPAIVNWPGWNGLAGANPTFPTDLSGSGDWSSIEKAYLDNFGKPAVEWRLKIFILANVDTLIQRKNGTWVDRRNSITGDRFVQTLNAIPQLVALVSAETGGKVRIVPDVHIDPEPSRDTVTGGKADFDYDYWTRYAEPRINGGSYQADDKKYRGPYDSVLVIDPCDHLDRGWYRSVKTDSFEIDDTPAAEVSFDSAGNRYATDGLALTLWNAWLDTVRARASARSVALPATLDQVDWQAVADLKEVSTATLLARMTPSPSDKLGTIPGIENLSIRTFKTANIKLSIVKDPTRGDVLQYEESRISRAGGVELPLSGPIDAGKNLTVTYKTTSDQPLSFAFWPASKPAEGAQWVSLGRDPDSGAPSPGAESLPVQPDGAWHTVTIDLAALKMGAVGAIVLGPSPRASVTTTELPAPVVYQFAEFKIGSDTPTPLLAEPTPDAASSDPQGRALAAIEEAKKGQPSPVLAKLLSDPDPQVVLNALAGYATVTDPAAEPKIIELSKSPSSRIAEFALKALAHQNTPTANVAIVNAMKFGFEYNKQIAAEIIAAKQDPKTAQDLVVLIASQQWHTRLEAAKALAQIPGNAADMMRLAILDQDDPAIKLEVIAHANPQSDLDMRKLLWEAVNEPSDAVRAASCEKLVESSLPDMRNQGLKGVRDDSRWTRVLLLRYLQGHPQEQARGAIKLALTDPSPSVRAEALLALSALDAVSVDEVQSALTDPDPRVDKALITLAKKHKLTLPDSTVEILKHSPDASLAAAWASS